MLDELEIYNLAIKYPNTVDLVREVEKIARADAIDEIHTELITEIAMLNATKMTDVDLYAFAVRIKEITDKLISK